MTTIRPLRCQIDTLEATMTGTPPEEMLDQFERRKMLAQGKEEPQPIFIDGVEFFVQPRGRGRYRFDLRSEHCHLLLGPSGSIPPMVKLLQRGLAERGVVALIKDIERLIATLGLHLLNCTRIDIACDFQGWIPLFDEMRHVVCPASFRPIYPSVHNPETFQFGKGAIVVRVYDKRKEIAASHKEWWEFVWRMCRHYVKDEPVWRVEVQLRSQALKEFGCRSVYAAIENIHGLFEAGLEWCSVRVPTEDKNPSRWPVHPAWAYLKRTYLPGQPLSRVKPAIQLLEYDAQIRRFLSVVSSAAVTLETDDYERVCRLLYDDTEGYLTDASEPSAAVGGAPSKRRCARKARRGTRHLHAREHSQGG